MKRTSKLPDLIVKGCLWGIGIYLLIGILLGLLVCVFAKTFSLAMIGLYAIVWPIMVLMAVAMGING